MICFQISIFVQLYTPHTKPHFPGKQLWFAFKLVSLYNYIHQNVHHNEGITGCDLLSNLYLCTTIYTRPSPVSNLLSVVICFQISIFVQLYTPKILNFLLKLELWFAFKLVSLYNYIHPYRNGCRWAIVVICFQISIFVQLYTPWVSSCYDNGCCDLLSN